jgi:hypothetical protein
VKEKEDINVTFMRPNTHYPWVVALTSNENSYVYRRQNTSIPKKPLSFSQIYMILPLYYFIVLFESPQLDLLFKRYANFPKTKMHFLNPDLEVVLLANLSSIVSLKF